MSAEHADDRALETPTGSAAGSSMRRFPRNLAGRDFAVGDIHGCFTLLAEGLKAIGFDEHVDRLFSVGDLVDRGPESDWVLTWLDRPWFHAICGNHDFLIWRAALGDPYSEVDYRMHGGAWLDHVPDEQKRRVGERLAALPLAIEVETEQGIVGLIHADCPFDDWREMHGIHWGELDPTSSVGESCLWSIERYTRQYVGQIRNVRAVVHGHMTVPALQVLGNVYFIDSCGWRPGGHFTFLDLDTLSPFLGPINQRTPTPRKNR